MNFVFLDFMSNKYEKGNRSIYNPFLDNSFQEILMISINRFDENFKFNNEFNLIAKPYIYFKLNSKIKKLANLSERKIFENGLRFKEAVDSLNDYLNHLPQPFIIFIWGTEFRDIFIQNCFIKDIYLNNISWIFNAIDLQNVFSQLHGYEYLTDKVSLSKTIKHYDIENKYNYQGNLYRSICKSRYMAYIYQELSNELDFIDFLKIII